MGLFKKKNTDYDDLFKKLATENLSARELKNAEKALEELAKSGDARGIIWRPLISIHQHKIKLADSAFSFAESQYGICEEYVRVRSLPVVFGLFSFWYDKYHEPVSAIFTARAYEHGWGTGADHARALEIIRDAAERIHEGAFVTYAPLIKKAYLEITGEEIPEQTILSAKSGESAEKEGDQQSGCDVSHDDGIKTVEDARRAQDNASAAAFSSSDRTEATAAAQDSADTADPADDDEWEEFSSVDELHEKLLRPELFRDPRDRYIRNSCMYLEPFVDEFREEFAGGDYAETKEIIAEILGVESDELTEGLESRLDFIRGFTEKEYLQAAMYSLAYAEHPSPAPYLANLAYYLWRDTGDGDYFNPLFALFTETCAYDEEDCLFLCAMLRIQKIGNLDERLMPDEGDDSHPFSSYDLRLEELLEDGYLPGSDGKMYLSDSGDDHDEEAEESDTGDDVLLRYQNGDSYRGAAVGGVREGFGAYFFADGGFYRGSFHADNYEGYGILDEGNDKVYKGLWKDDKRCGYGEQTYANGEVYRGWWKDNRFHGFGRYEFANGEIYVGEFADGMRHGISLMRRSNGKWYGERWNNDDILSSPTGPRVLNTKDGARYAGEVTERRVGGTVYLYRHGFGEVRFSDVNSSDLTDCYVGQFVNDSPCGRGVCIYAKEDASYIIASDDFRANSLPEGECRAITVYPGKSCEYARYYIGGFRNRALNGRGTMYLIGSGEHRYSNLYGLKSGAVACCNTFDGDPDGAASVTDAYGRTSYGRFVDGLWEE